MEREIRTRKNEPSERWLKLFGAKDSAVVNLQKLVQLLAELQTQSPQAAGIAPVDSEELAILAEWLKTTNAASACPAEQ
jgi:ABC-type transporter Mla MlaB component